MVVETADVGHKPDFEAAAARARVRSPCCWWPGWPRAGCHSRCAALLLLLPHAANPTASPRVVASATGPQRPDPPRHKNSFHKVLKAQP